MKAQPHKTERIHSLDSLRAIMMLLGVVLHSAITYGNADWGSTWSLKDPIATSSVNDYIVDMFVKIETTPNPNSLKFLPGKVVSNSGSFEITKKDDVKNELIRNLMSINGVEGIFLSRDFVSINKYDETSWDEIKHIVISLINDFYSGGKEFVIDKSPFEVDENLGEIEKKIVQILDQKIRPAVAKDGGDIKFKEFKDGVVMVQLQGSCSGCPSSTMTLKQGVQNLLCHYLPEVKEVVAI